MNYNNIEIAQHPKIGNSGQLIIQMYTNDGANSIFNILFSGRNYTSFFVGLLAFSIKHIFPLRYISVTVSFKCYFFAARIELRRLNTFGDEVFGDFKVLQSYYYAITHLTVSLFLNCADINKQLLKKNLHSMLLIFSSQHLRLANSIEFEWLIYSTLYEVVYNFSIIRYRTFFFKPLKIIYLL